MRRRNGFHVNPGRVNPPVPLDATVKEDIIDALRKLRRTVICHEDMAPELTRMVVEEHLEHIVRVVPTRFLEPGQAYIIASSVLTMGIKEPIQFTREWLDQWEKEKA